MCVSFARRFAHPLAAAEELGACCFSIGSALFSAEPLQGLLSAVAATATAAAMALTAVGAVLGAHGGGSRGLHHPTGGSALAVSRGEKYAPAAAPAPPRPCCPAQSPPTAGAGVAVLRLLSWALPCLSLRPACASPGTCTCMAVANALNGEVGRGNAVYLVGRPARLPWKALQRWQVRQQVDPGRPEYAAAFAA